MRAFSPALPPARRPTGSVSIPTPSAEAQQFFDRWMTPPTAEEESLYGTLIDGLVTDGIWDLLDQLVLFAAHDESIALTNLKSVNFNPSVVGVVTWTANLGYIGSGIFDCIDSGFNPSTAGGNYTRDNAGFGIWVLTNSIVTKQNVMLDSGSSVVLWPRFSNGPTNDAFFRINGTSGLGAENTDSSGFYVANRTSSTACALYRDGTAIVSGSDASVALPNAKIIATRDDRRTAVLWIGASLDSTKRTAFRARLATYLTAVGAI